MSGWRDCIVVLLDLIGVKEQALEGDSAASELMRAFHALVLREMRADPDALDHAYVWNDSALLLAYVNDRPDAYEKALRAAENLKRKVDAVARSYAIAVKGRAFPESAFSPDDSGITVIKASSYAMANCFEIEAEAKKKKLSKKEWYIDVRIARKVRAAKGPDWISVSLLPSGKRRRVYVHGRYLWEGL